MPLLDAAVPVASADAVAVFDENFNQVFPRARPFKVAVTKTATVMQHPVETGEQITDHRVIDPIKIQLSVVLQAEDFRSTYQQIAQLFLDAAILTMQTKASTYTNLIISEMPHDEDQSMFNAIAVAIKMQEVVIVEAQYGKLPARKVANKTQTSTVDRGEQQGKTQQPKGSVLYRTFFD